MLLLLFTCFFPSLVHSKDSIASVCLDVPIPYPFGIAGESSARSQEFEVTCNPHASPVLVIGNNVFGISEISLLDGSVRIWAPVSSQQCQGNSSFNLEQTMFTFSDTRNKFTALGCNVVVTLLNSTSGYSGGCASFCSATRDDIINGSCSGVACCQAPVPKGLKTLELKFATISNKYNSTPTCGEAFIAEENSYVFSTLDLENTNSKTPQYRRVALEWSINDGGSCEEAKGSASYACKENTYCYNPSNGIGYRCNCSNGFEGNPYLTEPNGCRDIDECSTGNPCTHKCVNMKGSFNCVCPEGMEGDGLKAGSGCNGDGTLLLRAKQQISLLISSKSLLIVAGLALVWFFVVLGFLAHCLANKRKLARMRQRYFMQNGGLLLKQQMFSEGAPLQIFMSSELEKATGDFSDEYIVRRGGFGTVYKGVLSNQMVVAIKRAQRVDQSQIEQFVNELIILSQVNHKNVVQLLGCCLETEVPLLVYKFITNGALYHHLHNTTAPISWENRLSIAAETASAVAHLHLATNIPIIHRDIKSSNILLDEKFVTKVSDFGASRSMPYNQTHVTTLVQGTFGYMDPEYFQTSQLTEKSDVYSFGVVLIELLTRKKPISDVMTEEVRSLALEFSILFDQNMLLEIIDPEVTQEAGMRHVEAVAKLAAQCLRLKGEERPRMIEVAIELEALRRLMRQHLILKDHHLVQDQESMLPGEMSIDRPLNLCMDGDNMAENESMEIILLPSRNL